MFTNHIVQEERNTNTFADCERRVQRNVDALQKPGCPKIEKTFNGKLPLSVCNLTASGQKALKAYRQQLQQFIENTQ